MKLTFPCFITVLAIVLPTFAEEAPKNAPVPDKNAQTEAMKLIREIYGDEYARAKSETEKQALAKKLLGKADETKDDLAARYVLLRLLHDVATQAKDGETAFQAIDTMAESFHVDAAEMRFDLLTKFASTANTPSQHKSISEQALKFTGEAVCKDDFATAGRLGEMALAEARKAHEKELITQAQSQAEEVAKAAKAYEEVKVAKVALEKTPDDPAANLVVGKYFCFLKGNWDKGLPMLALGKDEALKAVAAKELEGAASFSAQAKLGDGWWSLAEKEEGAAKKPMQARAAYWYEQALPGLSGLMKDKVEKRIAEAGPTANHTSASASERPSRPDTERPGTAAEEGARAKPDKDGWIVIFRSSDPSIWNSDVNRGKYDLSVSLSKVPADIKFLRMKVAGQRTEAIISITRDKLGSRYENGNYGWNGTNSKSWNAYHLGIYHLPPSRLPRGAVSLFHPVFAKPDDSSGCGFGHRVNMDDVQGYTWNLAPLPKTAFEISVKAKALTKAERKFLLQ